jgi:hypothetical protein
MTRAERDLCRALLSQAKANRPYTVCALKPLDEGPAEAGQVSPEAVGPGCGLGTILGT